MYFISPSAARHSKTKQQAAQRGHLGLRVDIHVEGIAFYPLAFGIDYVGVGDIALVGGYDTVGRNCDVRRREYLTHLVAVGILLPPVVKRERGYGERRAHYHSECRYVGYRI